LRSGRRRWGSRSFRADQSQEFAQLRIDLLLNIRVVLEELPGIIAPLADALTLVAVPRPALFNQVVHHGQVHQIAFLRNPLAVDDVELGFAKRRRQLVLYDLDLGTVAGYDIAVLDGRDSSDIGADAG